ncbi:MAG: glycosyltransferase family 4 protein, partial [Candidatus Sigynarchaeota archaeon]
MKKTIAFIMYNFFHLIENERYSSPGGAEVRVLKYLKYFATHGCGIEVLTIIPQSKKFVIEGKSGITYYNLNPVFKPVTVFFLIRLARAMRMCKARIFFKRVYNADVLYSTVIGQVFNKKVIYSYASDDDFLIFPKGKFDKDAWYRLLFHAGTHLCSKLIVQSEKQQSMLSPLLRKKSILIKKGADFIPPSEEILPLESREYFLWVGRFAPIKAPERLERIVAAGFPVKLAGRVPPEYQNLLEALKKHANFEYLGVLPPSELQAAYRKAIALINTSHYEGFPETFLEAWSFGTPVISLQFDLQNIGATAAGIYAKNSMKRMLKAMEDLRTDGSLFNRLSSAARELVVHEFNFKKEMLILT